MAARADEVQEGPTGPMNEVLLRGRLAAAAAPRTLPSGDVIVTWRLVVDRAPPARPAPRAATVDTIDCVTGRADLRRRSAQWQPGDVLEVVGALRRRFWRSPVGPASRTEVEAVSVRRAARAATPRAKVRAGSG